MKGRGRDISVFGLKIAGSILVWKINFEVHGLY
jgi:hypothetical protein